LDFLSDKHDNARRIKGLYDHISSVVPQLARDGFRMSLNTVIMESNLDDIIPLAHKAKEWNVDISYSSYCSLKSGDNDEMVMNKRFERLDAIVGELVSLKRTLGNIKNSDYYLKRIPVYFRRGSMPGCRAGYRWFQVTPDGYVQQCSELPKICRYDEFDRGKIRPTACTKCWYACRGEVEANHFEPRRLLELLKS